MQLLCHPTLKNDAIPEAFLAKRSPSGHPPVCRYIRIEPLTAHSPKYNTSLWHVALHGWHNDAAVHEVVQARSMHKEAKSLKLIMKHLRQRGLMAAFETLSHSLASPPYSIRFEHPLIASLHTALVCQGDFDQAEAILASAADQGAGALDGTPRSLFSAYIEDGCVPCPMWTRLDQNPAIQTSDGEVPSPRGGHQCVFVPAYEDEPASILLFGGWDGQMELDDTWRFLIDDENPQNGRWERLDLKKWAGPGARSCHQMCLHPATGHIYLFGRFIDLSRDNPDSLPDSSSAIFHSDFWRMATRGPRRYEWECLSSNVAQEGGPSLVFDHQMAIDSATDRLFVFGGKVVNAEADATYSGLYVYQIETRTWKLHREDPIQHEATGEAERLMSRIGHSLILDEKRRLMYVIAGQRSEAYLADMWSIGLDDLIVTQLTSDTAADGGPGGAFTQRAAYDPETDQCCLLTGLTQESQRKGSINSLWLCRMSTGRWTAVQSLDADGPDTPALRFAHQLVLNPASQTFYLFGGNPSPFNSSAGLPSSRLGDLWTLQLRRPTFEEVLQRAKFLVRRQRFVEMCRRGESVRALVYLQTALSAVTNHDDEREDAAYRQCMQHILAVGGEDDGTPSGGTSGASSVLVDGEDAVMGSRDDLAFAEDGLGKQGDQLTWEQRSATFSALLEFFPGELQQPKESLLDAVQ